jgi:hypothetical protein
LINTIKNNNTLNIVNNNDSKAFITKNEISAGFKISPTKQSPKKDKRKMYKKSQSMRFDEDEYAKDNKIKGILKKKVKNRRKDSSVIIDKNSLIKEKYKRRSSLLKKNIKDFEEYIVNFYKNNNSKNIDEKNEDIEDNKSINSNKSNKSNKSIKSKKSNKAINKTFKTKKSVNFSEKVLKKENENRIKEKEKESKKRISIKKEKDVKDNVESKRKSLKTEKEIKENVEPKRKSSKKEKIDIFNTKNLVENKSEIINIKTIEQKKIDENNDM